MPMMVLTVRPACVTANPTGLAPAHPPYVHQTPMLSVALPCTSKVDLLKA